MGRFLLLLTGQLFEVCFFQNLNDLGLGGCPDTTDGAMAGEFAFLSIFKAKIQREFTLDRLKDVEDRYVLCLFGKRESAFYAAIRADDLCLDKLLQDLRKKTLRYLVFVRYLCYETDLLIRLTRQI